MTEAELIDQTLARMATLMFPILERIPGAMVSVEMCIEDRVYTTASFPPEEWIAHYERVQIHVKNCLEKEKSKTN